ncbi:hypothetical protein BH23CHL2_BH23CHL2_12310 [soil metagenome]
MIDRLPLELFDDLDDLDEPSSEPMPAPEVGEAQAIDPDIGAAVEVLLVNCQWCAEQFDNELPNCPGCGATHLKIVAPPEVPGIITCQWCQECFEAGPTHCPSCNARVVIPGQHVLGEDDPLPDLDSRGMMARQAQSHQLLVGMMAGGIVDGVAAGLIGLALALFDDD